MPLCGSNNGCGCAIISVPAESGEINGFLPSINVDGGGTFLNPWNLTLDDEWAEEVAAAVETTPWTALTLLNSWANLAAPNQSMQYRRRGDMVQVRGRCGGGVSGTIGFNLPVGFRPPADMFISLAGFTTGSVPAGTVIAVNGNATIFIGTAGAGVGFGLEFSVSV